MKQRYIGLAAIDIGYDVRVAGKTTELDPARFPVGTDILVKYDAPLDDQPALPLTRTVSSLADAVSLLTKAGYSISVGDPPLKPQVAHRAAGDAAVTVQTTPMGDDARVELGEPDPDDDDGEDDPFADGPDQRNAPGNHDRPIRFSGHTHVWTSPYGLVGGNRSNPGCFGGSGDALTLLSVCACGVKRRQHESRQNDDYSTHYTYPSGTFPWGVDANEPGDEWPDARDAGESHALPGDEHESA